MEMRNTLLGCLFLQTLPPLRTINQWDQITLYIGYTNILFSIDDITTCEFVLLSSSWSDLCQSITITSVTATHGLALLYHFQPAMSSNKYLYLELVRATNPNILVINF